MIAQCTFDASKLAALAAAHPGENVKITIDSALGKYQASIVAKPGTATALDTTLLQPLYGCPYPPGCN